MLVEVQPGRTCGAVQSGGRRLSPGSVCSPSPPPPFPRRSPPSPPPGGAPDSGLALVPPCCRGTEQGGSLQHWDLKEILNEIRDCLLFGISVSTVLNIKTPRSY